MTITPENETQKRLEIVDYIADQIKPHVYAIALGGSMGYGQNFSVAPWCDIDTVIVTDRNRVKGLLKTPYFNQNVPEQVANLFQEGKIDYFWASKDVGGIGVDIFVYDKDPFEEFVTLKGEGITGFIPTRPGEFQTGYNFKGERIEFNRHVEECGDGFLYTKPTLASEETYWGGVPRDDFFFMSHIVHEEDSYYTNLSERVRSSVVEQLVKEHGPNPDLQEANILNTLFTFQTNGQGMRDDLISKIKRETERLISGVGPAD